MQDTFSFEGIVVEILHRKAIEDGGSWCILQMRIDGARPLELASLSRIFKVIGVIPEHLALRDRVSCTGSVIMHKGAREFKATNIALVMPKGVDAVRNYLCELRGVGRITAEQIVSKYADEPDIIAAIINDPARLNETFDARRMELIIAQLRDKWGSYEAETFLYSVGLRKNDIKTVYAMFRENTKSLISANPFIAVLAVGFKKCDEMAKILNLAADMPERIDAGIIWIVEEECRKNGHCAVIYDDNLIIIIGETLGVSIDVVQSSIARLLVSGGLIEAHLMGQNLVYPKRYWDAESSVARKIACMASKEVKTLEIKVDEKFAPSPDQAVALQKIAQSKVSVLTGPPGSGKTTIVKCVVDSARNAEMKIVLCAPTGIAARRMQKACGFKATTIHRALGSNDEVKLGNANLIVVDELSMVAIELFAQLLSKISDDASILLVGDPDQLPSIDPGNVLADIIESGMVSVSCLTQIHRQGEGSLICENAARINRGEMPVIVPGNMEFHMLFYDDAQTISRVVEISAERLSANAAISATSSDDKLMSVQVIVPTKSGMIGAEGLNTVLRAKLNPPSKNGVEGGTPSVYGRNAAHTEKYAVGDKTIQCENNYDLGVVNGEIGCVAHVAENGDVVVRYDDHSATYTMRDLLQIKHAYAITVHKSQGSEFQYLVIVVANVHGQLLKRRLIYTAITRGKKQVIIVGQRAALEAAIKNDADDVRYSGLAVRLVEEFALVKKQ